MKLDEVLSTKTAAPPPATAGVYNFEGDIESDDDSTLFRLYPNPLNRRSYYLIPKSEVDEIHQFSPEELIARRLIGQNRFRMQLKYDTPIQSVSIRNLKVGHSSSVGKAKRAKGAKSLRADPPDCGDTRQVCGDDDTGYWCCDYGNPDNPICCADTPGGCEYCFG